MTFQILALLLLVIACALGAPVAETQTPPTQYPIPKSRFYLSNVTAAHYSVENPVNPALFGAVRDVIATSKDLAPGVHPRIVMGKHEWDALVSRHANPKYFDKTGTWSKSILKLTRKNGPESSFLDRIAELESSGATGAFSGKNRNQFGSNAAYQRYRGSLKKLADHVKHANELHSHSFFLCAFWATVSEKQGENAFLPRNTTEKCINASVAWAKVLMSHRQYHCTPKCSAPLNDAEKAYLWNNNLTWSVSHDWYTAGSSLALSYDVLYQKMSPAQRRIIRSALSLLVMKRWTWGLADETTASNPNPETHPHRIFGNWAMYHSNLYLTNLAIEGETGHIPYADAVLKRNNATGFNKKMNRKFEALIKAFMTHTIYPDGSTFEDGYTYHTAFREGSMGFLAAYRRGINVLNTPKFRNTIHNAAQMFEPWHCAPLVGHSSGGGLGYPSYVGLFRYMYPDGPLPKMLWGQRFGKNFTESASCRMLWTQSMSQMAFLGDEHADDYENIAVAPESLTEELQSSFPLGYVSTRRGLIISRGSYAQNTSYMHFDARPDSMFLGHDNADRGVITFSALGRRWLDDLPWKENLESRKHSLMHVDGKSQALKAPSVTILKVTDSDSSFVASADLTYTSNVQWAPAWQGPNSGTGDVKEYAADGSYEVKTYKFVDREENTPWDLGWPMEDDAADIGFTRNMSMTGNLDVGFGGMNEWRRLYRDSLLDYHVRSTALVRSESSPIGFGLLVDAVSAGSGDHVFESYLVLCDDEEVMTSDSNCEQDKCRVPVSGGDGKRLDIHVSTLGKNLRYKLEKFDGHQRLVFMTSGIAKEEFWLAFHPHNGDVNGFEMMRGEEGQMSFQYEGEHRTFSIQKKDNILFEMSAEAPPLIRTADV